jgi:vacuolar protein sorting-associated protein 51
LIGYKKVFKIFSRNLMGIFMCFLGEAKKNPQESTTLDSVQIDKVPTILVLMLAQLCVYIEHTTVPKVTEVCCVIANHLSTVQCETS